jgi:hypothetical protein
MDTIEQRAVEILHDQYERVQLPRKSMVAVAEPIAIAAIAAALRESEEWRRDRDRLLTSLREMIRLRELSLRSECDPERHELDVVRDAKAAIDAARKEGV